MQEVSENNIPKGWFSKLPTRLGDAILAACNRHFFSNNELIFSFQDEQISLWCVVNGHVRLSVTMNEQEMVLGHIGGPGFWFGEPSLVTGRPRMLEAMSAGNTEVYSLRRSAFDAIARDHHDAWKSIAELAVCNQALAIGAAEDLLIRSSRKRLAAILLRLSSNRNAFQGNEAIDFLPSTQQEIASMANLSRSSASEILAEFASAAAIQVEYRGIRILSPKGLNSFLTDN